MQTRRASLTIVTVFLVGAASPAPTADLARSMACAELQSVSWSGFRVDAVEEREARDNIPAHCIVKGTIDSEIRFELLLPLPEAWTGRLLMGGGGGFVGSVQNQALEYAGAETVLGRGFATVGTDTGHRGSQIDASWGLDRPDRKINFGHRAVHLTAETAKTIVRIYYGRDIDYSYFLGCSRGGGQAMMSSQRFPDDFDGIVGGAPAYDWTGLGALFLQTQQAMYPDPSDLEAPVVTREAARALADAILEACDERDGVKDGIMTSPLNCAFNPEVVVGLTPAQLRAVEVVYGGALVDGEQVYPGFPFGGEAAAAGWGAWITGSGNALGPGTPNLHYAFGTEMHKYLIFDDPEFDYSTYDFSNWEDDTRTAAGILNATQTDLTPFKVAGGKLILWNGWSDPAIPATGTIEYYEAVAAGDPTVSDYTRLFLLPGVLHCAGGPGPDQVDWLDAIQRWVEHDEAPERLTATKWARGEVEMQRPICPYPAAAVYDGTGDAKVEASFECVTP